MSFSLSFETKLVSDLDIFRNFINKIIQESKELNSVTIKKKNLSFVDLILNLNILPYCNTMTNTPDFVVNGPLQIAQRTKSFGPFS